MNVKMVDVFFAVLTDNFIDTKLTVCL